MRVLENLEPKNVFYFFEEISRIPRPSYKEEKISNYLVNFAKERNLEVYQDDLKNVIIIKEATKGYEDVEPIILQGHMDMVCEKEPDCTIDFENDPLTLEIEGDYITAKGTTLGGDDGIAVAYALAILDSDTIEHPRLEVVITAFSISAFFRRFGFKRICSSFPIRLSTPPSSASPFLRRE